MVSRTDGVVTAVTAAAGGVDIGVRPDSLMMDHITTAPVAAEMKWLAMRGKWLDAVRRAITGFCPVFGWASGDAG